MEVRPRGYYFNRSLAFRIIRSRLMNKRAALERRSEKTLRNMGDHSW